MLFAASIQLFKLSLSWYAVHMLWFTVENLSVSWYAVHMLWFTLENLSFSWYAVHMLWFTPDRQRRLWLTIHCYSTTLKAIAASGINSKGITYEDT
jgi:hypothetical protein